MRNLIDFISHLFIFSLLTYLIFFIFEFFFPGFVTNNFNLYWFFILITVLGFLVIFSTLKQQVEHSQKTEIVLAEFNLNQEVQLLLKYPKPVIITSIAIIIISTGFFFVNKKTAIEQKGVISESENEVESEVFNSNVFLAEDKTWSISKSAMAQLENAPVDVLNGNTQVGSASAMAKFLKDKGFIINLISDADRHDYINAVILFRPEEMQIAEYLVKTIKNIYPIVERAPIATDSGEIILILGQPKT